MISPVSFGFKLRCAKICSNSKIFYKRKEFVICSQIVFPPAEFTSSQSAFKHSPRIIASSGSGLSPIIIVLSFQGHNFYKDKALPFVIFLLFPANSSPNALEYLKTTILVNMMKWINSKDEQLKFIWFFIDVFYIVG